MRNGMGWSTRASDHPAVLRTRCETLVQKSLWGLTQLADWVATVHELRMVASVAGKLSLDDIDLVRDAGADIAGVRGAACVGGRLGRVSSTRVRELGARVRARGFQEGQSP